MSRSATDREPSDESASAAVTDGVGPAIAPSRFCIDELSDGLGLPSDDERLTHFDEMLRAEFQAEGYEVVSSADLNETWSRVFESSEDIFDPHTGQRAHDRFKATRLAALDALHEEHGCDFLVSTQIVSVSATWRGSRVTWDGAESFFTKGMMPGSGMAGYVGALSLHLRIVDLAGELVHFGTGGIQVTSELRGGLISDTFIEVDPESLLTLKGRNRNAIRLTLGGMKKPAALLE